MKFKIYCDPSHSWIKVHKNLIKELNLQNTITRYSYVKGDFLYLEVDCDYSWFVQAMKDAGKSIEIVEHHSNRMSRIRSYDHYQKPF